MLPKIYLRAMHGMLIALIHTFLFFSNASGQCNDVLQVTVDIQQPCNNDGILTATVTTGTPPYTYEWKSYSNPNFSANTQIVTGVKPGYYFVEVTDATGQCGSNKEIGVYPPFTFSWQTTPANCPATDGSAEITSVSGGAIPYTYLWSNGATTQRIENVASGMYYITITDANGCVTETSALNEQRDSVGIEITQLNDIQLTINPTPANCSLNSGQLSAIINAGGLPPFSYEWKSFETGQTWNTQSITNIPGNTNYEVVVTDAQGCFAKQFTYLHKIPAFTVTTSPTNENCDKGDGTISGVANGGKAPYSWVWDNGMTGAAITGLQEGYYKATITDADGCQETRFQYVFSISPIILNPTVLDEICDQNNGSISIQTSFGNPPYSYAWNTGETQNAISGLSQGSYQVVVTDSEGCTSNGFYYIQNKADYSVQTLITNEKCETSKGSIQLEINGGDQPMSFIWSNGMTTQNIVGLDAGYYTCTITDAGGCATTVGANVFIDNQIFAYISTQLATCEEKNGALYLSANGTHPPFSYLWSDGSVNQNLTSIGKGDYWVTITDQKGCSIVKNVYLSSHQGNLNVQMDVTQASCIFEKDGQAEALVSGGTPPYQYRWGTGETTTMISGLPAYFGMGVIVTDQKGCIAQDFVSSIGFTNYDCAAIVRGKVWVDDNVDCTETTGEKGLENVMISCLPTAQGYTRTATGGDFQFYVPKDQAYVINQHPDYLNPVCPTGAITTSVLAAGQISDGHQFYDTPYEVEDLKVSMSYTTPPRPGFDFDLFITVSNVGLYKTTGEVKLNFDPSIMYITGANAVDITNHELTLFFTDLPAFFGTQKFQIRFIVPVPTPLGRRLKFTAHVYPDANDATLVDNEENLNIEVVGSYDPNDISVKVIGGQLTDCLTEKDSLLQYTIRFQNTGNFPASFVTIKNKIDVNLDMTSLRAGTSSHPYRMQILPDGNLAFLFDPIYLPDSTRDEKNSHGFVTYYIKPKKQAPNNTLIPNQAAIYFDYNEPIITNTVQLLVCKSSSTTQSDKKTTMSVFPNPAQEEIYLSWETNPQMRGTFQVTNALGQIIKTVAHETSEGINHRRISIGDLSSGSYFVRFIGNVSLSSVPFIKM